MIIFVDIDGTICTETPDETIEVALSRKRDENIEMQKSYVDAKPYKNRIAFMNKLYDEGHTIHYWTARGARSRVNWTELTMKQLEEWGCKYHELSVGSKPHFDVYICDKSHNSDAWFGHYLKNNDDKEGTVYEV